MSEQPTPETDAAWACFKGHTELLHDVKNLSRKLEQERVEARKLAQWLYTRLKQVCLDHPLYENVDGILARLEEAVIDDPWLEDLPKNI